MADQHFRRRRESPIAINVRPDAWAASMDARLEAWRAYRCWCAARRTQERSASIRYRAAADREDAAAFMLQSAAADEPVIELPASGLGAVRALALEVGQ